MAACLTGIEVLDSLVSQAETSELAFSVVGDVFGQWNEAKASSTEKPFVCQLDSTRSLTLTIYSAREVAGLDGGLLVEATLENKSGAHHAKLLTNHEPSMQPSVVTAGQGLYSWDEYKGAAAFVDGRLIIAGWHQDGSNAPHGGGAIWERVGSDWRLADAVETDQECSDFEDLHVNPSGELKPFAIWDRQNAPGLDSCHAALSLTGEYEWRVKGGRFITTGPVIVSNAALALSNLSQAAKDKDVNAYRILIGDSEAGKEFVRTFDPSRQWQATTSPERKATSFASSDDAEATFELRDGCYRLISYRPPAK